MRNMLGIHHSDIRFPKPREGEKANGDVITYRLSSEELAKYRAMDKPQEKKEIKLSNREEGRVVAKLTKEQYLQAREEGKSDEQIAEYFGMELEVLKMRVAADREAQKVPVPQTAIIAIEQYAESKIDDEAKIGAVIRLNGGEKVDFFGAPIGTEYLVSEVNNTRHPFRLEYVLIQRDTGNKFRYVPLQPSTFTIMQRTEPPNDADKTNGPLVVENAAHEQQRNERANVGDVVKDILGRTFVVRYANETGIADSAIEARVITPHGEYTIIQRATEVHVPIPQTATGTLTDNQSGEQYINVRVPIRKDVGIVAIVDLERREAFQTAYHMLEQVIAWVAEDLEDLLGTLEVDKLQAYVDRQVG